MTYPIPTGALDDRLGFVGTAGSGKTYAAGTAVERLLASGARVVIVDPLDVWYGLRLTPQGKPSRFALPIFGGAHGDLPLNEGAGKLIGETVATMADSCIVSLKGLGTKESERRFMLAFLEAAYRRTNGSLTHWIFDEADLWAPQNTGKGAGPQLQALMEAIVRRGRVDGFIPWLITQRPAVISKDVLSQVDGLVVMKLTASQDRDAIGAWVSGQADVDQWKEMRSLLPTLDKGSGLVWLPGHGKLDKVHFPLKATFDSSRAPKRGEKRVAHDLTPLDLEKLKGKLAKVEDEARANDPKALKVDVARLTRELATARRELDKPKPAPVAPAPAPATDAAALAAAEQAGFDRGLQAARHAIANIQYGAAPPPADKRIELTPRAKRALQAPIVADGSVPSGCAKPLAALAQVYPSGLTDPQWAIAAGYKRSGGTWGTYKSRLRQAGLAEQRGDRWFATELGAGAVGDVEAPPPPGPELVRWWAGRISGTPKIAEVLIAAYPTPLSKEELADRVEMTATGGSFGTYLSRLAGPGLIDREAGDDRRGIVLRSEVMA